MIEQWGRGFDKIKEACESYANTPLPEYDISETGVMVLCKPCEQYLRLLRNDNSLTKNERIMSELLSAGENKKMAAIINYLLYNDTITNKKCCELTGKSTATARRYLDRLCEVGLLESSGGTKNAIYRKTEKI
jgi:ATP-dependent DNA helicase RecG